MKTGSVPEPALGPRWAARELGLDATDRAAARAEFLRRLPEADFLPPSSWSVAVAVLNGRTRSGEPTPAQAEALHSQEPGLRAEVDAFTARFFQIEIGKRRRQWQALAARCQEHPKLATWLAHLETGLDVRTEDLPEQPARVAVLARNLSELFILRPAARGTLRRELLSNLSRPMKPWQEAARTLEREHPDLAALDPLVMEQLTTWEKTRSVARNPSKPWGERYRPSGAAVGSSTLDNLVSGMNFLRYGWIILVITGAVFRAASCTSSQSDSNRYYAPAAVPTYFNQPYYIVPNVPPVGPNQPGQGPGEATRRLVGEDRARQLLDEARRKAGTRPGEAPRLPFNEPRRPGFTPPGQPPIPVPPTVPQMPGPRRP